MSEKKKDQQTDSRSFEDSLTKLEELVRKLEAGDLPLEESLQCYEQGMGLITVCRNALDKAEQRIQLLTESEQGDVSLQQARVDGEEVRAAQDKGDLPFDNL